MLAPPAGARERPVALLPPLLPCCRHSPCPAHSCNTPSRSRLCRERRDKILSLLRKTFTAQRGAVERSVVEHCELHDARDQTNAGCCTRSRGRSSRLPSVRLHRVDSVQCFTRTLSSHSQSQDRKSKAWHRWQRSGVAAGRPTRARSEASYYSRVVSLEERFPSAEADSSAAGGGFHRGHRCGLPWRLSAAARCWDRQRRSEHSMCRPLCRRDRAR